MKRTESEATVKYRKKPVVIEAELYKPGLEDGYNCSDLDSDICQGECGCWCSEWTPWIDTLEGKHFISEGDYIITGVKGDRYPCKPDIFMMTYEPVEGDGED